MKGGKTYQGPPCVNGHDGTRYSATRRCVACALATQSRLYDKATQAARKRAYRARQAAKLESRILPSNHF